VSADGSVTARDGLAGDRDAWRPFLPAADRLARIDPGLLVRLRADGDRRRLLSRLTSGALIGVAVRSPAESPARVDVVTTAGQLAGWLSNSVTGPDLARHDEDWLTAAPPERGWRRVEAVPVEVVSDLVRAGAAAHDEAARLALGARAADTLLDTAVLVVTNAGVRAEVANRSLSALVAMNFLPPTGEAVVAISGHWTRVATERGSVFAANRVNPLGLL
jgi:hypothetical protein